MADLPTINALDDLREENKEQLQSLGSTFKGSIDSLTSISDGMAKSLRAMLEFDKKAERDKKIADFALMEQLREAARKQQDKEELKRTNLLPDELADLKDTGLLGLAGILVAFAGALAGLRGTEAKVIKGLGRSINSAVKKGTSFLRANTTVLESISNAYKNLRVSVLKIFGLTPGGLIRNNPITGRFEKAPPLTMQIADKLRLLKAKFLGFFGLTPDGKINTKIIPQGGRASVLSIAAKSIGETIGRVTKPIGNMLRTLGRVLRGVPILGQIIGFFFALFDGIKEAFNTDGPAYKKFTAFLAGFVGDFVGAPLDLLKSILSWAAGKLGFEGVESFLDSFSIEQFIKDSIKNIPVMIEKVIDWFGTLFTDPTEALNQLWQTIVGVWKGMAQFVMDFAVKPAWEWMKGLFGFGEDEAVIPEDFNPVTYIIDKVTGFAKKIMDELGKLFSGDIDIDSLLPDFQMPEFPNPFKGIGDRIASLDFDTFNLGSWFGGALDLNLGDKLKNTLAELFGAEGVGTTVAGTTSTAGAETDVRSRTVAQITGQPNVTVAAPQTSIQTDNSTRVNRTSVAPASSRRRISYRDRYGASLGIAGIRG